MIEGGGMDTNGYLFKEIYKSQLLATDWSRSRRTIWYYMSLSEPIWTYTSVDDLGWSELRWYELIWAEMIWAELIWAELRWVEMSWDELIWANLIWAELRLAEISWAELSWYYLSCDCLSWYWMRWDCLSCWAVVIWCDMIKQWIIDQ